MGDFDGPLGEEVNGGFEVGSSPAYEGMAIALLSPSSGRAPVIYTADPAVNG